MSSLVLFGDTSGSISLTANSIAGSNTLTVPAATGTLGAVLIASQTANSSATIDFTSIYNTTFNSYLLQIDNVVPVNNGVSLLLRFSTGGTFQTTNYQNNVFRFTTSGSAVAGDAFGAGTSINLVNGDTQANSANYPTGQGGGSFTVNISNCAQTTTAKRATWLGAYYGSTFIANSGAGGYIPASNAVDGFRILYSSGNISTGTFKLYGFV